MFNKMKKSTKTFMVALILIVLAFLFVRSPASFVASSISPTQYVGDLSKDDNTETYRDRVVSSSTAQINDYKLVSQLNHQYVSRSSAECEINLCNGDFIGNDKYGCPLYSNTNTYTSTIRCEHGAKTGFVCPFNYCGYFTGGCDLPTDGCDSVSNVQVSCVDANRDVNTNGISGWTGDSCIGKENTVKLIKTAECTKSNLVCGGLKVSGAENIEFGCVTKMDVYYKGKLVNELRGTPQTSEWLTKATDLYLFRGDSVSDSKIADLIVRTMQTSKYVSSPRDCLWITNDYQIPINDKSFETNITKEGLDLTIEFKNNFGRDVKGFVEIDYSTNTVLGGVTKTDIKVIDLPISGNDVTITLPKDYESAGLINVGVKLNIADRSDYYSGINLPARQCLDSEGLVYSNGGELVDLNKCSYVKLGVDSALFQIVGKDVIIVEKPIEKVVEIPVEVPVYQDKVPVWLIFLVLMLILLIVFLLLRKK